MIRQTIHAELLKRLKEKRRFVQVVAGPRQVGKTTPDPRIRNFNRE
jgi:predicted AAA+ superfamily ATPase